MNRLLAPNQHAPPAVAPTMNTRTAHLTQPGLAQVTIHSADAATVHAVAYAIAAHLNATGPTDVYRIPGEDGVMVSQYVHVDPPPADDPLG